VATKRKFKSDAFEAIHSSASAMYKVGAIGKPTTRSFDASCLRYPSNKMTKFRMYSLNVVKSACGPRLAEYVKNKTGAGSPAKREHDMRTDLHSYRFVRPQKGLLFLREGGVFLYRPPDPLAECAGARKANCECCGCR
jgi:hypothetical protein